MLSRVRCFNVSTLRKPNKRRRSNRYGHTKQGEPVLAGVPALVLLRCGAEVANGAEAFNGAGGG
jgi:hypothetical protein